MPDGRASTDRKQTFRAGTYRCTNCGETIDVGSVQSLPPCPNCGNNKWETLSGGDGVEDPYPDQD